MVTKGHKTIEGPPSIHRVCLTYDLEVDGKIQKKELPFVIGVLADLAGKPEEPLPRLRDRRFIEINRDNFDHVLKGLNPRVAFKVDNKLTNDDSKLSVELRFKSMEDFEPMQVVKQIDPLRALLLIRIKLANLRGLLNDLISSGNSVADSLVDRIVNRGCLGQTISERESGKEAIHEFLTPMMNGGTTVLKDTESKLTARIKAIDQSLSSQLDEIIHALEFQKLEASWRGLEYLVSRTETSPLLKIRVMNVSKEDLRKDLEKAVEFDQSVLFRKVYEEEYGTPGGEPYAVLIGDYYFDREKYDISLLEKISNVAAAAQAPFIAGAHPKMFNFLDFSELVGSRDLSKIFEATLYKRWKSFRQSDDARYVGLVLPHILLRLPYGKNAVRVYAFEYEENVANTERHKYLWGNAAYAFATHLVNAFHRYGWCPAIQDDHVGNLVRGLPTHSGLTDEGEVAVKCPAEIAITGRRKTELAALGFISLCHKQDTDMAIFYGAPSCGQPKQDDDVDETRLSVQLESIMGYSRFAHYLKVMMRGKKGNFMSRLDCERFLNDWIAQYVQADDSMKEDGKARFPLRQARIEVIESAAKPGVYRAVAQFKFHHLTVPPE